METKNSRRRIGLNHLLKTDAKEYLVVIPHVLPSKVNNTSLVLHRKKFAIVGESGNLFFRVDIRLI